MKKIVLFTLLPVILIACGGTTGSPSDLPDGNGVIWLKQSNSGFEALVSSSFSVADMQRTFGGYCQRNNKATRSLRMEPYGTGQQRAIGACL